MKKILVDVRTREEYVMEHIRGAVNIPHYDLAYYSELLADRQVVVYCNTGKRSLIAQKKLAALGMQAEILANEQVHNLEKEGKTMVLAINRVYPKPDREAEFMAKTGELCRATEEVPGFLGSKILKMSGISAAGSYMSGDTSRMDIEPPAYLLLTFWESEEDHERYHHDPHFAALFSELPGNLVRMPYEEFYQVLK